MFFQIKRQKDIRFTSHYYLVNGYFLNADPGWKQIKVDFNTIAFVKGYAIDNDLNRIVDWREIITSSASFKGNFTAVIVDLAGNIEIKHDVDRAYPLIYTEDTTGNIGVTGENVWADHRIRFDPVGKLFCNIDKSAQRYVDLGELSMDDAAQIIYTKLKKYFSLLQSFRYIKIFPSGGVDTMLCLAMLRHCNIDHEIVDYEHWEYDHFNTAFHNDLEKFWGYRQLHHWCIPTTLVSGAMGDENFARNPQTVSNILDFYNIKINDVLSDQHYHYQYFNRPKNAKFLSADKKYETKQQLINELLNTNANDHQHWHLGNTITFTAFKDLDIFNTVLHLNRDDLVQQMLDATLQKHLIEMVEPNLLDFLLSQKNYQKPNVAEIKKLLS